MDMTFYAKNNWKKKYKKKKKENNKQKPKTAAN